MTMQEMYSRVKAAINAQGAPSMTDGKQCLYRGPNGRKCAIGWLIPDDQYDPGIEGTSIDDGSTSFSTSFSLGLPAKYFAGLATPETPIPVQFLKRLQRAHDHAAVQDDFLQTFNTYMADIASAYSLKDE